jgi:GNAT superfamily N-acetyltransferase
VTQIRELTPDDAEACDAILLTLPTFFGHEGGRQQCAEAVRTQKGFVAVDGGEVIGFLTLSPSQDTLEITWMAVRNDRRRSGAGRALVDAAAAFAGRPLSVFTAGPSSPEPDADPDDNYEGTRDFYRKMGFIAVTELTPQGWDQSALILVRFPDSA